ncbi:hypothetical protein EDC94DRAFT_295888 [Helicostylum pulchrum]|nr:hypothetical protein EDC94DRAFT_295888 [Helicostylum pulchrum]
MSWKEAQAAQYEYSDEEEYSDDEYEPVNVASWGNQTVTDEGTTQIDIGWGSLVDPNVKVKAGGVGSGQLHRRGGNFKPLDEQFIINQRLGKPIPKALSGGKKKGGKRPKGPPPARRPPPSSSSSSSSSMRPPSSSMYRSRAPVAPGQGPWGSGELASTPFWEQPANSSVSGTNASKYATPAPAAAPQRQQPPPQQYQQQQQYQQYQQPAAVPAAPVAPARQPEPTKPITSTLLGSGASKYATSAPAQQYQQYQQPPPPPQQRQQQQYQQPVQQPVQQPSQQQQRQPSEVTHRFDLPCLNFNIEMAPGINAKLSVYSDDDPVKVVDRFERDHNLIMSDEQKSRFADKVARLLVEYR